MKNSKNIVAGLLLILAQVAVFTFAPSALAADCDQHLPFGVPSGGSGDKVLCYEAFAVSYDYEMKVPSWTSSLLTRETVHGKNVKRASNFKIDKNIPRVYSSSAGDYSHSGHDKGHIAGSAQHDNSRSANDETFLYTNAAPQLPGFNRDMMGHEGAWGRVESLVRKWVYKHESLIVISGTYFNDVPKYIGNGVGVPSSFYKIILNPTTGDTVSFWFPHVEDTGDQIASYIVSIDEIEKRTGIDFLARVDDAQENYVEKSIGSLSF